MSNETNPYAATTAGYTMQPTTGDLADRSTRLVAAIVDALIVLPLAIPAGFVLGFLLGSIFGDSFLGSFLLTIAGGLCGIAIYLAVHGYFLATSSQTIGKKLFKIQIVKDDGSRIEFTELVLKRLLPVWVISMIPYLGGFLGLVNVLAIFRENRKCVHDEIAGTKVIKIG